MGKSQKQPKVFRFVIWKNPSHQMIKLQCIFQPLCNDYTENTCDIRAFSSRVKIPVCVVYVRISGNQWFTRNLKSMYLILPGWISEEWRKQSRVRFLVMTCFRLSLIGYCSHIRTKVFSRHIRESHGDWIVHQKWGNVKSGLEQRIPMSISNYNVTPLFHVYSRRTLLGYIPLVALLVWIFVEYNVCVILNTKIYIICFCDL